MGNNKEVIVITGCSGRIGKVTVQKFQDPRYQIVGLDIVDPSFSAPNFDFVKTDLTSDLSVIDAMEFVRKKHGDRIASVIHLAAYYSFAGGEWDLYEKITIQGTERLLHAVQKFQTEQFLFSSTMLVNAPCDPPAKITEDAPLAMHWEYPKSKVLTEGLILKEHDKIPVVLLRIAGCYDDDCHCIPVSNQIQRIYEHQLESRLFPGNLSHGASYIHLDDLADAIYLCVQKRAELPGESIFLLGEEETLSYDTLQREISKILTGKEMTTLRIPKACAKFVAWMQNRLPFMEKTFIQPWMIDLADENYTLDISRIKKALNWEPKRSLRKTLPIMIKALTIDPQLWYKENDLKMPEKCGSCCGSCKK